ncbi:MAG: nucleotidyltransferase family protein [Sulfurimonas sp.]|jgi:MurNAc alpha-1-phosphate uridylyltransferase|nr:nucleotidyltransferase family protein [Sulfurimonadaceae bacterium]
MVAMILAAGRGKRLRPLSDTTPKPLIKVHKKPIIEYHLERLAYLGFSDIVINMAHLGEQLPQTLGSGKRWGLNIHYSDERDSGGLESAGGIIKALAHLSDTFLVVNGDIMSDYEFDKNFELKDTLAHLVLVKNPLHNPYGDFGLDGGLVIDEQQFTFSGIGYYSKKLFANIELEKLPLAPILRTNIANKQVSGELYSGRWIDIGTVDRLREAEAIFV